MKLTKEDKIAILYRVLHGNITGAREYAAHTTGNNKRRARHPNAPYCTVCPHKAENRNPFEKKPLSERLTENAASAG